MGLKGQEKQEAAIVSAAPAGALSVFGTPEDIKKMFADNGGYLPAFKIVHPIECTEFIGKAVIQAGEEVKVLKAPYMVGVVNARHCARLLGEDKKYTRGYMGAKSNEQFVKLKEEAAVNTKVEVGRSVLLAVWESEDTCALAVAEVFKTMSYYTQKLFSSAMIPGDKAAVRIKIDSHMQNMDANKDDPTRKYFAAKKFKRGDHWEQLEVTAKMLESLKLAFESNAKAIVQWEQK